MEKRIILNNLIKSILFIVLTIVTVFFVMRIVNGKESHTKLDAFFREAENIDILFIGSSQVENGINTVQLYEEHGFAGYNLGCQGSALPESYWILKNALDYCTPKLVVIDTFLLERDDVETDSLEGLHKAIDAFPFSKTKWDAIREQVPDASSRMEFVVPFLKYHSRWKELDRKDWDVLIGKTDAEECFMGSRPVYQINTRAEAFPLIDTDRKIEESTVGMEYLGKMIDLCKASDIQVLLIHLPYAAEEKYQLAANAVAPLAEAWGVPFLNMMYVPQLINQEEDLASQTHLSSRGAYKVTSYLGQTLENFSLSDHRGEKEYESWEREVQRMHKMARGALFSGKESIETVLMLLESEDYDSCIFINHGTEELHDPFIRAELAHLAGIEELAYYEFDDSCLIIRDHAKEQNLIFEGITPETKATVSFGEVTFLSVCEKPGVDWNSLTIAGNPSLRDLENENLLQYYERNTVPMQAFVFDAKSGEYLGERIIRREKE